MNEELHDIFEPAISSNTGWQQMNALLNEHLPVKRNARRKKFALPMANFAVVITLLLFSGLQLDNGAFNAAGNEQYHGAITTAFASAILFPSIEQHSNFHSNTGSTNGHLLPGKRHSKTSFFQDVQNAVLSPNYTNAKFDPVTEGEKLSKFAYPTRSNGIIKPLALETPLAPRAIILSNLTYPGLASAKNKAAKNSPWSLSAGIGFNKPADKKQSLHPYPVFEARYRLNATFFIAMGAAPWSQVSSIASGVTKTVYVNDTINNISLYNETAVFKNLHYADIPVSLGVHITNKISVSGGIQMSVLMSKKTEKILSPYDFQMNSVNATFIRPVSLTAPPIEQVYDAAIRTIDYRIIAGIRYTIKKMDIGIGYQQGLRSIGSGSATRPGSNHLFALNLLFKLK